jgi:mono/diheme cytochrome c family protein
MKTAIKFFALTLVTAFGLSATASADDAQTNAPAATLPADSTKTGVTYASDIKPIFDAACVKCHNTAKRHSAGVGLDSLDAILKGGKDGKILTAGDSAHSDLVLSVAHVGDSDTFMPKHAKQLTPEQIGLIRAWIDQGAK